MLNQQETVLIVDDEATVRKLLRQKLSREGYGCEEAGTSEQTLLEAIRQLLLNSKAGHHVQV